MRFKFTYQGEINMKELVFKKIENGTIFATDFRNFCVNNTLEFSTSGIAVVYGPNGTGKTSFINALAGKEHTSFIANYEDVDYNDNSSGIFHVILDQNNRNIIEGTTRDFFLGDNIQREFELKDYIDSERNRIIAELISSLKNVFGISSSSSKINTHLSNASLKGLILDLSNSRSKGSRYKTSELISVIKSLDTILTMSYVDTIGTLYDCYGNKIDEVDDRDLDGDLNFRITQNLTAGNTYYVKVRIYGDDTGSYTLRITDKVYANYVTIAPKTITLKQGVLYELPLSPNYVYKGYNGAERIPGLSVSIDPANASEQKVDWWEEHGDVLDCSFGWDDDGDRYIHVRALTPGSEKLYARDWNENGKSDTCTVTVVPAYKTMLQEKCGFSSEETDLILKLYESVDTVFSSESTLQKAWKCARVLSEFSYDTLSSLFGITYNKWNNVAGSITTETGEKGEVDRKTYFINTLAFTETEYNALNDALDHNHENKEENLHIIDFTHMQYALAARLAYTLDEDGLLSNIGTGFVTDNFKIYTEEEISYLGGWLGDATLIDEVTRETALKNDDYMADLDAENIYHIILQGNSAVEASNTYYASINDSNTRADIFLQHIPYNTVEEKIFDELLDDQNDAYEKLRSNYHDTYNFLKSLNDRRMTLGHYQ